MIALLALLGCPSPAPEVVLAEAIADAGPDLVVDVGEAATLDGSGGVGVRFEWDFGDGVRGEGPVVEHTWEAPGTYTAVVRVTGEDGAARTDSARVLAVLPALDPPPVASSTLAVVGDVVWVVNPEAGTVGVIEGGAVEEIEVCEGPRSVAIRGGEAAVACDVGGVLVRVDVASRTVTGEADLGVGSRPFGVVGRAGGWWVGLEGIDAVAEVVGDEVTVHAVGPGPRAVAAADGVWSARFRSAMAEGMVYRVGGAPVALPLDPGPDSDTTTRGVPNLLQSLAISPDGGRLAVAGTQANVGRGAWRDGQPLTHETTLRAVVRLVDTASGEQVDAKVLDDQGLAGPILYSPLGDRLVVAHPGTRTLQILDAWSLDVVGSIHHAGSGIAGLAWADDGTLLVHAWLDREVRVYDVSDLSQPPSALAAWPTLTVEPLSEEVLRGKALFHDAGDLRMARDGYLTCAHCHPDGRDDGLVWDFTDRGEGLRNTASLEGRAGTGMGPLHWSANFDEVQDFEHDIRGAFGGTGFLSEADWAATGDPLGAPKTGLDPDLDALAAYVASLVDTPASPHPGDPEGETLFVDLGCDACHPPPLYTDSDLADPVRHDVGTLTEASGGRLGGELDGLDTPTLLGVWATGPWLHDGSAGTLEEAIGAHVEAEGAEIEAVAGFVRGL